MNEKRAGPWRDQGGGTKDEDDVVVLGRCRQRRARAGMTLEHERRYRQVTVTVRSICLESRNLEGRGTLSASGPCILCELELKFTGERSDTKCESEAGRAVDRLRGSQRGSTRARQQQ